MESFMTYKISPCPSLPKRGKEREKFAKEGKRKRSDGCQGGLFGAWNLGFGVLKKVDMSLANCSILVKFIPLLSALCSLLILLLLLPIGANAQGLFQGITGSLEFNYNYLTSKTTDATGNTVKTRAQTYFPRFQFDINTDIFPNLRLMAGGIAEGFITDLKSDGSDVTTTQLNFRPYIDLTLRTPFYWASMGYVRRQQITDATNSSSINLIRDEYYGILGLRPEGLPFMELQLRKRDSYDDAKSILNTTEELISLNSRYQYKGLLLDYYGTYLHTKDEVRNLDVVQQTHTGRASYSDSFLDKRLAVNTNYNVLYQGTTTKSTKQGVIDQGVVTSQAFPTGGLFAIDDTPLDGALNPNPALIDGDLTASAGINIGLPPGVDTSLRNIGLDFTTPTEVNRLLLWVDRDLSTASDIVNFFSLNLKVYVSSDNLNWVAWPITPPITFGPFENRFEIKFANVVPPRRFIKVVTPPLSPAVPGAFGFPNIFITELQAFLDTSTSTFQNNRQNKTNTITNNYDIDLKMRILDDPSLFYEFYGYYNNRQNAVDETRYTISNAFYTFHRFNEVFSGRARVAVENGKELEDKRVAYIYDAALIADPLRTLHNSLVVNGRNEEIGGRPNDVNSVFLYNTAQLYKGIDVSLNGGVNFTKQETGESGRDFIITFQTNIVPHRTLTLGLNYNNTVAQKSGGNLGSTSTTTQILDINLNYNPFTTLNLFAYLQYVRESGQKDRILQNYAINWMPFPDGALQFNIAYNENYRSEDHLTERIFVPSVRYYLSKRSYLQVSYQLIRSSSDIEKIDSNLFSTSLKIYF